MSAPTMAIATATSLDVHVGGKLLFDDVSFKLEPRERMTLSGRNGAGKSTLLRVLAGELTPDSGSLALQKGRAGRPARPAPAARRRDSLGDYVFSGRADMHRDRGRAGAARGGDGRAASPTRRRCAPTRRPSSGSKHGGGYRWRDDVLAVLRGLGFGEEAAERQLSTFSGGELTRASLARALAARPDLLLLDEPTNHLDIPSLEWLERYLVDLDAAVVLVAHDRWFLEAVGTSVLELEAQRARFFAGPWHAWRKEQAAREIALGKAIERQQAEIERMERFVERFRYKATKAQTGAVAAQADRQDQARRGQGRSSATAATCASPSSTAGAARAGRAETGRRDDRGAGPDPARRRRARSRARRARRPRRPQRRRQDDPDRDPRRAARAGRGLGPAPATTSSSATSPSTPTRRPGRGTVLDAAQRETGLSGQKARDLLGGFLFSGADAEKSLERHLRRRAAAALAGDPGRLRRQRADPRRAHQPPRHREPRGARGRAARPSRAR